MPTPSAPRPQEPERSNTPHVVVNSVEGISVALLSERPKNVSIVAPADFLAQSIGKDDRDTSYRPIILSAEAPAGSEVDVALDLTRTRVSNEQGSQPAQIIARHALATVLAFGRSMKGVTLDEALESTLNYLEGASKNPPSNSHYSNTAGAEQPASHYGQAEVARFYQDAAKYLKTRMEIARRGSPENLRLEYFGNIINAHISELAQHNQHQLDTAIRRAVSQDPGGNLVVLVPPPLPSISIQGGESTVVRNAPDLSEQADLVRHVNDVAKSAAAAARMSEIQDLATGLATHHGVDLKAATDTQSLPSEDARLEWASTGNLNPAQQPVAIGKAPMIEAGSSEIPEALLEDQTAQKGSGMILTIQHLDATFKIAATLDNVGKAIDNTEYTRAFNSAYKAIVGKNQLEDEPEWYMRRVLEEFDKVCHSLNLRSITDLAMYFNVGEFDYLVAKGDFANIIEVDCKTQTARDITDSRGETIRVPSNTPHTSSRKALIGGLTDDNLKIIKRPSTGEIGYLLACNGMPNLESVPSALRDRILHALMQESGSTSFSAYYASPEDGKEVAALRQLLPVGRIVQALELTPEAGSPGEFDSAIVASAKKFLSLVDGFSPTIGGIRFSTMADIIKNIPAITALRTLLENIDEVEDFVLEFVEQINVEHLREFLEWTNTDGINKITGIKAIRDQLQILLDGIEQYQEQFTNEPLPSSESEGSRVIITDLAASQPEFAVAGRQNQIVALQASSLDSGTHLTLLVGPNANGLEAPDRETVHAVVNHYLNGEGDLTSILRKITSHIIHEDLPFSLVAVLSSEAAQCYAVAGQAQILALHNQGLDRIAVLSGEHEGVRIHRVSRELSQAPLVLGLSPFDDSLFGNEEPHAIKAVQEMRATALLPIRTGTITTAVYIRAPEFQLHQKERSRLQIILNG